MYTKNNVEALADIRLSVNLSDFAYSLLCTVPFTLHSLDYPNCVINVDSEHSRIYYSFRLVGHTDIAL